MNIEKEIEKECLRLEEDCIFSSKGHFVAASYWKAVHLWIGIPSSIMAGIASVSAFKEETVLAGVLAIFVASLGAISTFLNPSNKSTEHTGAGNNYLMLRNKIRRFRNIELPTITVDDAKEKILTLGQQKDDLSSSSPQIPDKAFIKARKNIEDGQTQYQADK